MLTTVVLNSLTQEFFDWLDCQADVVIVPREFLDPEEMKSSAGEAQWFGEGEWVTTMSLD